MLINQQDPYKSWVMQLTDASVIILGITNQPLSSRIYKPPGFWPNATSQLALSTSSPHLTGTWRSLVQKLVLSPLVVPPVLSLHFGPWEVSPWLIFLHPHPPSSSLTCPLLVFLPCSWDDFVSPLSIAFWGLKVLLTTLTLLALGLPLHFALVTWVFWPFSSSFSLS